MCLPLIKYQNSHLPLAPLNLGQSNQVFWIPKRQLLTEKHLPILYFEDHPRICKWLVTPMYKLFKPFGRCPPALPRGFIDHGYNHLCYVLDNHPSSPPAPPSGRLPKRCGPHQVSDWVNMKLYLSHSTHVWYMFLRFVDFHGKNAGKQTSPVNP